jgi:hypothetical protein
MHPETYAKENVNGEDSFYISLKETINSKSIF